jgi:hypothetical protein
LNNCYFLLGWLHLSATHCGLFEGYTQLSPRTCLLILIKPFRN